ncbi:MAG: hypothetical protein L3J93_02590, partial [Thermoplasmata archaeon]|nr:hypothetical protein [Thermoplasmata archaeon]
DLELLFESLDRMASARPRRLMFSHFGESPDGPSDLTAYRRAVEEWRDVALSAARTDPSPPAIARALRHFEERAASEAGGAPPVPAEDRISGYDLAAQGLLRYFRVHGLLPG